MSTDPTPADGRASELGAARAAQQGERGTYDRRRSARRRTEDALALYRAIVANSTEAIAIIDVHGVYIEQNDRHRTLLGYSDDELRGRTPAVHMGEEVFRSVAAELEATGQCCRELVSRTRDGRTLDIELSAFVVRDHAGRAVCHVGIKRDVSERKRAERELERRYAKLLTLYDMADAVSRADGMARIHEAALTGLRNALGIERAAILLFDGAGVMRFAAWRGLSEEYRRAVEGHSPWSRDARDVHPIVVPDVTLDAGLAGLQEVLRAEGIRALAFIPLVDEGRLLGKLMVYLAEPYQLDDDELRLAQTLARHVSLAIARDRAATTLRESEQAQRLLAETSGVLAASLDFGATLAGVARLVVPRLADLCLVDLVGGDGAIRRVATAANDPERELALAALRAHYAPAPDSPEPAARAIRTGAPVLVSGITDEMLAAEARDEVHHALLRRLGLRAVYAVPLAARGHVAGAITFGVVDSGRRYGPAERALADEMARRAALAVDNARLFRQAQEANHAKSRFLTTMSHELRTPLNAIAGYAELLELGIHGPVSEEQRESLRRIRVNQRHLLGLIDDVLSFATLDAGQLLLAVDDVPLGEVLTEAHALIEPQLRAKRLGYDLAASYDGIRVRADRHRLVQVLLNLLSNAAKFTEPGGSVRTEWEVAERLVRIHVRDSGPGIPADKLEAIFQPFYQLNPGLTRRSDGTGLGLPISRELARAMGGDVWAASVPGEGAVFTVTVPLA